MARASKRTQILDAAFAIVGRDGVRALTYEALAAETGLTKGGLLYHFASREALVQALHEHLAEQWTEDMWRHAGRGSAAGAGTGSRGDDAASDGGQARRGEPLGAAELDDDRRLEAYVRSTTASATRAELLLMLESVGHEASAAQPWQAVLRDWAPTPPAAGDEAGMDAFVAGLAADGLWLHEALTTQPLGTEMRRRLVEHILRMARGDVED